MLSLKDNHIYPPYIFMMPTGKSKIDSFTTPTVKMNFPSDEELSRQFWACSGCDASDSRGGEGIGSRDTQQHIMVCPGYAEF